MEIRWIVKKTIIIIPLVLEADLQKRWLYWGLGVYVLDKALMHLMACSVVLKHLQNDVVGNIHAHDFKGIINYMRAPVAPYQVLYRSVSCVSQNQFSLR